MLINSANTNNYELETKCVILFENMVSSLYDLVNFDKLAKTLYFWALCK